MSGHRAPEGPDLTRNIAHAFLGNVAAPVAWIVVLPVLSRVLGVEGRGVVAAATSPLLLGTSVGGFGIAGTLVFVAVRHPHLLRRATRLGVLVTVVLGALATVGLWFLAPSLAEGRDGVAFLIRLAAFALVPTLGLGIARGLAMSARRWQRVQAEQSTGALTSVVLVVVLAATGSLTRTTAVLALAYGPVLGVIAYTGVIRLARPRPSAGPAAFTMRHVARFAVQAWIGDLTGVTLSRLDQVIMIPLAGEHQLGLYVLAVNIAEIPLLISAAVTQVSYAEEARAEDHTRAAQTSRITLLVCGGLAVLIAATAPVLVPLVFGGDFAPAYPSIVILLASVAVTGPASLAGAMLAGRGRPGLRTVGVAAGATTNVVVLLLLAPHLGAVGAAWATLAGGGAASLTALLLYRRVTGGPLADFVRIRRADWLLVRGMGARVVTRRKQEAAVGGGAAGAVAPSRPRPRPRHTAGRDA